MSARYQATRIPTVNVRTSTTIRTHDQTRYGHVRPARPSLRSRIALGIVLGLAAIGLLVASGVAFVIVWAVFG